MRTKKLKLHQIGTCPHCGAPIYNENADDVLPKAAYSCECRFTAIYKPAPQPTWPGNWTAPPATLTWEYWSVPYNPWPPVVSIGGGTIGPPPETVTITN